MVTTLYSNFSDAQGQITLLLVSVSGQNLNSSKLSCMSSLPARMRMIDSKTKELECSPASMKKIRSKMKALEWSQHFPHYNPMGAIRRHGHQSSDPIWPKTYCRLSPTQMMVQNFGTIGPLLAEIFEFENVDTQPDRQTDRHTDDGSTGIL